MSESISRRDLFKAAGGAAALPLVDSIAGTPGAHGAGQRSAHPERGAQTVPAERQALALRGPAYNVMDFGARGDGVTDDTAAIEAADVAATAGAAQVRGGGRRANGAVLFPAGTYVHAGLHYRGAPWIGAGINATVLRHLTTGGASIDAVGENNARRLLSISDLTLDGSGAAARACGLRLGYNMRSLPALRAVRIQRYPAQAISFAADNWILSFHDVFLYQNAGGAFGIDRAVNSLEAFEWFNLVAEENGTVGSGVGGLELAFAGIYSWHFFGGTWESNKGAAEARFINCNSVILDGVHSESDKTRVTDGVVFGGTTIGSVVGGARVGSGTGKGLVVRGTANVSIEGPWANAAGWTTALSVEDTARVMLSSEGRNLGPIAVQDGAACIRLQPRSASLSDSATIAVDASRGTIFVVTLTAGGHRMGKPTNPSVGQRITFCVYQDRVGGHTLTWDDVYRVTWSDTNNRANYGSLISFIYFGGRWNQDGGQSPYGG